MTPKFQELVAKLKEIFQLDKPELDFGLYRIMHAKSAEVTDFLEHRLEAKVRDVLGDNAEAEEAALRQELETLLATLQQAGVNPETSPKVQELRERIAAVGGGLGQAESEVYSHLLTFFSRYYDQGDFISKRRYNGDKYAIPYAGEEVKLHWANADQYYIKSGENFTNYDFTLPDGAKVHFKLVAAATAKDNIKDADAERRFVLWIPEDNPVEDDEAAELLPEDICEEKDGELFIYFQYKKCQKGTRQTALIAEAEKLVLERLNKLDLITKYPLAVAAPTEKDKNRSLLKKHLERYTARNTCDYFIHKDLQGFLTRELDFYIKNEMLHLDELQSAASIRHIERQLRRIQAVRAIAGELIAFMAQLENFQKRLWLKKKFVTRCEWCVTMDRLPEDLRAEALANPGQQAEWRKLGFADPDEERQARLPGAETAIDARMVDTKFFDESFKARLFRAIPDIDEQCDGVLIHSENFQALNLLQERYKGKIQCVYIDPPYNTGDSEILYKNTYIHASWLTLIENRIIESINLLKQDYVYFIAIDDFEAIPLCQMLDSILPIKRSMVIVNHHPQGGKAKILANTHEYMVILVPEDSNRTLVGTRDNKNDIEERPYKRSGTANSNFRQYRPNSFYAFLIDTDRLTVVGLEPPPSLGTEYPRGKTQDGYKRIYPIGSDGIERVWRNSYETALTMVEKDKFKVTQNYTIYQLIASDEKISALFSNWTDKRYNAGTNGATLLEHIMGDKAFGYPKSLYTVIDALNSITDLYNNSIILDYFAGSGTTAHAIIELNRTDKKGGKRKYILVEMGEHFDTVLKPRIEKVVYSPEWEDGRPIRTNKGISHCFKYMTLESYEDALGNIEPADRGKELLGLMRDEYLLHYMLDLDAQASLINTDSFKHPFDYHLKIAVDAGGATEKRKIDLIETFNYLIGLTVHGQDRYIDKGYVFVDGALPNGDAALVIWRDVDKVDNAALNRLLEKRAVNPGDTEYAVIFVNGDHAIPNRKLGAAEGAPELKIRQLENVFLEKMFEES